MDDKVLKIQTELCRTLTTNQFYCHFIATDGDSGMNELHNQAFAQYEHSNGVLADVLHEVTRGATIPLTEWPISDLIHLETNARAKLATSILALLGGSQRTLMAKRVADNLQSERMRQILCDRKPLDFLKDDLALETFTLENLLKLWGAGNPTAAYWMSPFVALNVALRNPRITIQARLGFIPTAFSVFFDMAKDYPETGADAHIFEVANPSCGRHSGPTSC
jgi:hypothetical protein